MPPQSMLSLMSLLMLPPLVLLLLDLVMLPPLLLLLLDSVMLLHQLLLLPLQLLLPPRCNSSTTHKVATCLPVVATCHTAVQSKATVNLFTAQTVSVQKAHFL